MRKIYKLVPWIIITVVLFIVFIFKLTTPRQTGVVFLVAGCLMMGMMLYEIICKRKEAENLTVFILQQVISFGIATRFIYDGLLML